MKSESIIDQYCITTAERHPFCTYVTQLLFLGVITSKKSLRLPVDLTTTMERGEVMLRGKTKAFCHILVNTFTEMSIVGQFVRPDILWIRHLTIWLYLTNWRFAFWILTEPSTCVGIFSFGCTRTNLRLLYLDTALPSQYLEIYWLSWQILIGWVDNYWSQNPNNSSDSETRWSALPNLLLPWYFCKGAQSSWPRQQSLVQSVPGKCVFEAVQVYFNWS